MIDTSKFRNCVHQYNRLKDFCENNWEDIIFVTKDDVLKPLLFPRKDIAIRGYSKKVLRAIRYFYKYYDRKNEKEIIIYKLLKDLHSALIDYRIEMGHLTNEIMKEFHQ